MKQISNFPKTNCQTLRSLSASLDQAALGIPTSELRNKITELNCQVIGMIAQSVDTITMNDLTTREIIVYKCQSSETICMLTKLSRDEKCSQKWGFVPIGRGNYGPCFIAGSFYDAIKNCPRRLFVFDEYKDFAKALYGNQITS